jgi:hypothetical protein
MCSALAFILLVACAEPLFAESSLRFEVRLSQKGQLAQAEVLGSGEVVLALTAADPQEANEKASLLADKMRSFAAVGKTPDSFAISSRAGNPALICDSEVLVVGGPSPNSPFPVEQVMAKWLENIKRVFSRPYLSAPSTLLAVRVGREVALSVCGPGLPLLQADVTPSYVASARADLTMGRVIVTGKCVGQAQLTLKAKGETLCATISVVAAPPLTTAADPTSDGFPPAAKDPPLVTWFSNHPENVAAPLPLFHAQFPGNATGRLFYHHKSIADGPMRFVLWVVNREPEKILKFFLIQGAGGPDPEAPIAGRDAIASFFSNLAGGQGEFITLNPGEMRCLKFVAWPPSTTVGGLVQFTCLGDAPLDVFLESVESLYQPYSPSPTTLLSPISKEWLFPGDKQVPFSYVAGGAPVHFLLGFPGERALTSQRTLPGSYGVQQRLDIRISNPTAIYKRVELRCLAAGGNTAHFVALLDGHLLSVELPRSGETASLATFTIAPGTTVSSSLLTTGVGGCWYPVVITLQTQT